MIRLLYEASLNTSVGELGLLADDKNLLEISFKGLKGLSRRGKSEKGRFNELDPLDSQSATTTLDDEEGLRSSLRKNTPLYEKTAEAEGLLKLSTASCEAGRLEESRASLKSYLDLLKELVQEPSPNVIHLAEKLNQISKNNFDIFEYGVSYFSRSFKEGKKITWVDGLLSYYYLFKTRFLENEFDTILSIIYSCIYMLFVGSYFGLGSGKILIMIIFALITLARFTSFTNAAT